MENDFCDQNQTHVRGGFVVRESGINHIAGSLNGALIFLLFA